MRRGRALKPCPSLAPRSVGDDLAKGRDLLGDLLPVADDNDGHAVGPQVGLRGALDIARGDGQDLAQ